MSKRQLIIIPGLGDKGRLYRFFVPLWSLFGFQVHIFIFGWERQGLDFATALARLTSYVDSFGKRQQIYIIGVSAGGTAAINVLDKQSNTIAKIVTICTPYEQLRTRKNELLRASIRQSSINLLSMSDRTRHKILSTYGMYDEIVPIAVSKPDDIVQKRLWSIGHGLTIFLSLTLYSNVTRRFFTGV